MVSKITIFEPHFDGAQFGPAAVELEAPDKNDEKAGNVVDENANDVVDEKAVPTTEDAGLPVGRSRARSILVGGLLSGVVLGGITALRYTRCSGQTQEQVEIEDRTADGVSGE